MKLFPSYVLAFALLAIAAADGAYQLYSHIGQHLLAVIR